MTVDAEIIWISDYADRMERPIVISEGTSERRLEQMRRCLDILEMALEQEGEQDDR